MKSGHHVTLDGDREVPPCIIAATSSATSCCNTKMPTPETLLNGEISNTFKMLFSHLNIFAVSSANGKSHNNNAYIPHLTNRHIPATSSIVSAGNCHPAKPLDIPSSTEMLTGATSTCQRHCSFPCGPFDELADGVAGFPFRNHWSMQSIV